jgi:hypothetical protein
MWFTKSKRALGTFLALAFLSLNSYAQDDLLAELEQETKPETTYTFATFKGNKVVNLQTNEIPAKGVLEYNIMHRFGSFQDDYFYNFLGLTNAQVRLTLNYSPLSWLNLGLGHTGVQRTYDGFAKYKLVRQSKGKKSSPVSITGFSSVYYSAQRPTDDLPRNTSDRFSFVNELVIARKFNQNLSLQVVPTVVHFNVVERIKDNNTVLALGAAGRYKFTKMHAITFEYIYQFNPNEYLVNPITEEFDTYRNALSIGVDIETGGHVFQLFFTNSRGVAEPYVFAQTPGSWLEGDIHFGFNISRVFTIQKPKQAP